LEARKVSILIRGMEMPENCGVCRFAGSCGALNVEEWPDLESIVFNDVIGIDGVRAPGCPLIPVHPHGRLIDGDALAERFWDGQCYFTEAIKSKLQTAPTIIPAEEGET
jgi:hypothetical protein